MPVVKHQRLKGLLGHKPTECHLVPRRMNDKTHCRLFTSNLGIAMITSNRSKFALFAMLFLSLNVRLPYTAVNYHCHLRRYQSAIDFLDEVLKQKKFIPHTSFASKHALHSSPCCLRCHNNRSTATASGYTRRCQSNSKNSP